MSDYRRVLIPGGTYFFTLVTYERRPLLTTELARQCLREAWRECRRRYPFQVEAACLLPDHLHCVWTLPEGDSDFSCRWNMIKGLFSKLYLASGGVEVFRNGSRQRTGEAGIWQRRFWDHCIRDDEDLRRHLDYIHFNPVKHGLAGRPSEWPWSSFHRAVGCGTYEEGWGAQEPKSIVGLGTVGE